MFQKVKIFLIITVPIFLILHFLGWWKYYYVVQGYDKIVHVLAGASVVLVLWWLLQEKTIKINKQLVLLIVLFFISIGWEVLEYLVDHIISRPALPPLQLGWIDTLGDFLANFAGAIMVLIWFYFKAKKQG